MQSPEPLAPALLVTRFVSDERDKMSLLGRINGIDLFALETLNQPDVIVDGYQPIADAVLQARELSPGLPPSAYADVAVPLRTAGYTLSLGVLGSVPGTEKALLVTRHLSKFAQEIVGSLALQTALSPNAIGRAIVLTYMHNQQSDPDWAAKLVAYHLTQNTREAEFLRRLQQ